MLFEKLVTLVPLSKLDPEPADLTERVAQATLGGYQALWHPSLLSRSATLPAWSLPADPPVAAPGQLFLVPEPTRRLLSYGWEEQALAAGAIVIAGEETRSRFLARLAETPLSADVRWDGQLDAADFYALGLARLWIGMLTAYMKHVSTLDEEPLQKEVLAAAAAAVLGDQPTRDDHLRAAFQLLKEARERLYPVDVHMLDLCLLDPRAGMDRLGRQLNWESPLNVFASGHTTEQLRSVDPAAAEQLRAALEAGRADLVGGEYDEVAATLLPLESHLWQFRRGEQAYRDVLGRTPLVFGRRRFGLGRHVLQLLNRLEFLQVTHFCFDDGIFPTKSDPKVRLEAPDSSTVEALARIPFAADNALEFLKFPSRLAATMSSDFVATITFVHWPMPDVPWYEELLRMTRFANVFARFSTLSNYFSTTDPPAISSSISNDDYASPFLAHSHERGLPQPISDFGEHHRERARFENVRWLVAADRAIRREPSGDLRELEDLERMVEERDRSAAGALEAAERGAAEQLAQLIVPAQRTVGSGTLVFNTLCFDRRIMVAIPPPANEQTVAQGDSSAPAAAPRWASVDVPAMGFRWISHEPARIDAAADITSVIVDGQTIRNGILEVEIDPESGGLRSIGALGIRSPQLGQRLVMNGITRNSDYSYDATPGTDAYSSEPPNSEMRATRSTLHSSGPDLAEVVVEGDLIAQPSPTWANDSRMARFRQTFRLGRGQSVLRLGVEIMDITPGALDARAGPWQSYLASRFAWPDPRSLLVRAVGPLSGQSRSQRPESPYFVEIHGRRHRTTILSGGLPFHQRSGDRMLDTLLITSTETCRVFEFGIGIDLPNPFQAALDLITPPVMIAREDGPPPTGPTGWFFHLDVRNVVVCSMTALGPDCPGVRLRLFESAGRYTRARLGCLRKVAQARMTDFHGQRLSTLVPEGDAVPFDLAPHEIAQIELEFA